MLNFLDGNGHKNDEMTVAITRFVFKTNRAKSTHVTFLMCIFGK